MTEKEKRDAGCWFDPDHDPELIGESLNAKDLCHQYNMLSPKESEQRRLILKRLLGSISTDAVIQTPFSCDYGYNIEIGDHFFMNHGCVILDGAKVTFGKNVFVGPQCGFYTPTHPMERELRCLALEKDMPITIGDDVWIGGGVTVLGGVSIGHNCIIGAGSVVTKSIPDNSLAYGNPCKVVRRLN